MRRLKESRVVGGVGFILASVLLVLTVGLLDPAGAQQQSACDFLTGTGRVTATAGNGMASFSLASRVKQGAFWGHLTYQDDGVRLKLESTGITKYLATGPATRVIEGTASTNLYGDRFYRVTVTDNGESGRTDTFQIELDNGYFTHGTLLNGNVALLKGNRNSTALPGFTCSGAASKGRAQ